LERKWLSQEGLKLIACVSMVLDHIGFLYDVYWLRILGRLAFPIYCFLLVEGTRHTHNPKGYALRLAVFALISEIPFDYLVFGRLDFFGQNVMFTLLLGFGMLMLMRKLTDPVLRMFVVAACAGIAQLLLLDYGAMGILVISVFAVTELWWLRGLLLLVLGVLHGSGIQVYMVLALIPILLYSGKKQIQSSFVHRFFYLVYPVHMIILAILRGV